MRKLVLALAGAAVLLSTGVLTNRSDATPLAGPAAMRGAIEETATVDQVRLVCTHFWNGRYHRREICHWTGGYRHRHWHHYGRYHRDWRHRHHHYRHHHRHRHHHR